MKYIIFIIDLFTTFTKRLIKFDNEKWFNLNINEKDLNIYYTFQLHSPQVDIDNSLWWIADYQEYSYKLVHLKNGTLSYYYVDSIYRLFDTSSNLSRNFLGGLVIDKKGIKHFLTNLGIVSFDNYTFSLDTNMNDFFTDNVGMQLFISQSENIFLCVTFRQKNSDKQDVIIFERKNKKWSPIVS